MTHSEPAREAVAETAEELCAKLHEIADDGDTSVADGNAICRAAAMIKRLSATREAPVGWAYESHEFGDVWQRRIILNRPDGGANPPTKHYGSPVRNVRAVYDSASASPAAGGLEAVRVTRKLLLEWSEDFDEASKKFERLEKCVLRTRAQECRDLAALASPAATSAETQGGDGVREALELARPVIAGLIDAEYNVDTWGLKGRLAKIDAALGQSRVCEVCGGDCSAANPPPSYCPERDAPLAPSTSAATRGEPVAWMFDKAWGSGLSFTKPAPMQDDDGTLVEPVPLYAHPAPAVESAQVKEAFLKGFSAGESYHNSKWHHYKAPDLNAAWASYRASLATDAEG